MFVNLLLALLLAIWRNVLCFEYGQVSFEKMVAFEAPMPFASRVLLPLAGRIARSYMGLSPSIFFLFTDFLFAFLLFETLRRMLSCLDFSKKSSLIVRSSLGVYIALLYSGLSLLDVFYPWDLPSAAFLMLATSFVYFERNILFCSLLPIALLNRETAILYPLIYAGISKQTWRKRILVSGTLLFLCYSLELAIQQSVLYRSAGELIAMTDYVGRLRQNFDFIFSKPVLALVTVFPVPLFWMTAGVWFPGRLRGLVYISLSLFAAAFIFGNAFEPRVFVESVIATALPAALWYRSMRASSPDEEPQVITRG